MSKSFIYRILGLIVVAAGVLAALLIVFHEPRLKVDAVLGAYDKGSRGGELTIAYPLSGTLFPPEIASPTFRWKDDNAKSDAWVVAVQFQDGESPLNVLTRVPQWMPSDEQWEAVKRRSLEKDATVAVIGVNHASPKQVLSSAKTTIRTSRDEVGAPLFYREVNLPFSDAVKDPSRIRWRFGAVSSKTQPPIVLEGLPVCGNCHSFSADGQLLGMDVDYANDKGAYAITGVEKEVVLAKSKVMSWAEYKREDKEPTFGLLSQVSPDGKYVVSTVKDRSLFVPKLDLEFSQLFFPLKGILAVYRRDTGTFFALPGADDKAFVHSNPAWSPDGKSIVFARSKVYPMKDVGDRVLLTEEECREFLKEGKTFLFDLYRIPFNDGKGGKAEPLAGASNNGLSNYFAKYSPDGKWIVFCRSRTFMLLQPDSDLYIMPAEGGEPRRMVCNTPRMNSWHSWSPNGKWLVFSSKANGPYTQLFLTHIDEGGNDTPSVLLERFTAADRAANIPEFVNVKTGAIKKIHEQFVDDVSFARAGLSFLKFNDFAGAERAYRKALELNPAYVEAHANLGLALAQQGKMAEAVAHFTEAIRLNPAYADAHNNLGLALAQLGKIDEAAAHFAETIRLDPNYAAAHFNLGLALVRQGKTGEAAARFAEAIRVNPSYAEAHNRLGLLLAQQAKFDEAVAHFNEAIQLNPQNAEAHNNLGTVLIKQGKPEEAVSHFSRALQIRPDFAQARANMQEALCGKKPPPVAGVMQSNHPKRNP